MKIFTIFELPPPRYVNVIFLLKGKTPFHWRAVASHVWNRFGFACRSWRLNFSTPKTEDLHIHGICGAMWVPYGSRKGQDRPLISKDAWDSHSLATFSHTHAHWDIYLLITVFCLENICEFMNILVGNGVALKPNKIQVTKYWILFKHLILSCYTCGKTRVNLSKYHFLPWWHLQLNLPWWHPNGLNEKFAILAAWISPIW